MIRSERLASASMAVPCMMATGAPSLPSMPTPVNSWSLAPLMEKVVSTLQLSFLPNLTFRGGERAQIEAVRVAARLRGSGVGGEMIRWSIEEARSRGCHLVQLTTDKERPEARRFYERLGFVASHEGMKLALE